MNIVGRDLTLPDAEADIDTWRRQLLAQHIDMIVREHQRDRFIGQILFVAALLAAGAILYWAAQALGIDVPVRPDTVSRWTVIVTAGVALLLLGMAVVIWDSRLRLGQSKLRILERELELQCASTESEIAT